MSDYFEKKVVNIEGKINSWIDDDDISIETLRKDLILLLKEVARDQKYKCIEKVSLIAEEYKGLKNVQELTNIIENNIHNSNL
jgi:hypothetical protein